VYRWVLFLHILSVILFFMLHGATAALMFQLRREHDHARVRALMDIREPASRWMSWLGVVMFLSGIALGFLGRWWGQAWIWVSIGALGAVSIVMGILGRGYFDRVAGQLSAGQPSADHAPAPANPGTDPDPDGLSAALASGRPWLLTSIGLVTLGLILWLMIFKPF
jgi:hypothetical protein